MLVLTTCAKEESTYVVTAAFTDEDGDSVIPNAITWSLTDRLGNIINEREDISIGSPAASVDIVLSGDDLAIGDYGIYREIVIEATYDSTLGSDLPLKCAAQFEIENYAKLS